MNTLSHLFHFEWNLEYTRNEEGGAAKVKVTGMEISVGHEGCLGLRAMNGGGPWCHAAVGRSE